MNTTNKITAEEFLNQDTFVINEKGRHFKGVPYPRALVALDLAKQEERERIVEELKDFYLRYEAEEETPELLLKGYWNAIESIEAISKITGE